MQRRCVLCGAKWRRSSGYDDHWNIVAAHKPMQLQVPHEVASAFRLGGIDAVWDLVKDDWAFSALLDRVDQYRDYEFRGLKSHKDVV